MPAVKKDYIATFNAIVRAAFLGERYHFGRSDYVLNPTLLDKYEVLRSIVSPASELERLVKDLPQEFKSVAHSELYRKSGGWFEKGRENRLFKEIEVKGKPFIVPILGKRSVGIDTSSDSEWTYICVACFDDAECGHAYLERHLQLPKAKQPPELKWMKLNPAYRTVVVDNIGTILEISSKAVLIIKTNALVKREEKLTDTFIKLIDGCFSGYEQWQGGLRAELKRELFMMTNETPVHCDADFSPLTADNIVRHLVKTLAGGLPCTPLYVGLKSEESRPIQVADIICGVTKSLIGEDAESKVGLKQIPFDNKLSGKSKDAKAYFWRARRTTQVPRVVTT